MRKAEAEAAAGCLGVLGCAVFGILFWTGIVWSVIEVLKLEHVFK